MCNVESLGAGHFGPGDYVEIARDILRGHGYDDWYVVHESVIECPHGTRIEWDGECPKGCRSPFISLGLI